MSRWNVRKNSIELSIDVPSDIGDCGICHQPFCRLSDSDDACCRTMTKVSCCQHPICCRCLHKISILFTCERGYKSVVCTCPFCRRLARVGASDAFLGVSTKKCKSCSEK